MCSILTKDEWITLVLCIRVVLSSNMGPEAGHSYSASFVSLSPLDGNVRRLRQRSALAA